MEKVKENVLQDFINMIEKSWTYDRLTEKEKENLQAVFESVQITNALKGTYKQRWEILQVAYTSFLYALNYTATGWREQEETPLF